MYGVPNDISWKGVELARCGICKEPPVFHKEDFKQRTGAACISCKCGNPGQSGPDTDLVVKQWNDAQARLPDPCPRCGAKPDLVAEVHNDVTFRYRARCSKQCTNHNGKKLIHTNWRPTRKEAWISWHYRVRPGGKKQLREQDDPSACPKCGERVKTSHSKIKTLTTGGSNPNYERPYESCTCGYFQWTATRSGKKGKSYACRKCSTMHPLSPRPTSCVKCGHQGFVESDQAPAQTRDWGAALDAMQEKRHSITFADVANGDVNLMAQQPPCPHCHDVPHIAREPAVLTGGEKFKVQCFCGNHQGTAATAVWYFREKDAWAVWRNYVQEVKAQEDNIVSKGFKCSHCCSRVGTIDRQGRFNCSNCGCIDYVGVNLQSTRKDKTVERPNCPRCDTSPQLNAIGKPVNYRVRCSACDSNGNAGRRLKTSQYRREEDAWKQWRTNVNKYNKPTGKDKTMNDLSQTFTKTNDDAAEALKAGAKQAIGVAAQKAIMDQFRKLLKDQFPTKFYATPLGEAIMDGGACYAVLMATGAFPEMPMAAEVNEYTQSALVGVTAKSFVPLMAMVQQMIAGLADQAKLAGLSKSNAEGPATKDEE